MGFCFWPPEKRTSCERNPTYYIMTTYPTPVERPLIRVSLEDDVTRLKKWLKLIKTHTEDGAVLAFIDLALDDKEPTEEDKVRDNTHEYVL